MQVKVVVSTKRLENPQAPGRIAVLMLASQAAIALEG